MSIYVFTLLETEFIPNLTAHQSYKLLFGTDVFCIIYHLCVYRDQSKHVNMKVQWLDVKFFTLMYTPVCILPFFKCKIVRGHKCFRIKFCVKNIICFVFTLSEA